MDAIALYPTRCAICNSEGNARELYSTNFDRHSFNAEVFSARRLPDRIHYRLVKCNICGLVRSDPVVSTKIMEQLYFQSAFEYDSEVKNLKATYGRYLSRLNNYGARKEAILEIGCGNGFFLEEALDQGYSDPRGIEPSTLAVAKADSNIRQRIICDVMRPGLFQPEQFNVICMFQVLDHISDPLSLLNECFRILKSGGLILCINHNIHALSVLILQEYSPIIDIEHTYLFNKTTMGKIFKLCNFEVKEAGTAFNRYALFYLVRLLPLPSRFKNYCLSCLQKSRIGKIAISVPLGNFYLIAQKPIDIYK